MRKKIPLASAILLMLVNALAQAQPPAHYGASLGGADAVCWACISNEPHQAPDVTFGIEEIPTLQGANARIANLVWHLQRGHCQLISIVFRGMHRNIQLSPLLPSYTPEMIIAAIRAILPS